MLIRQKTLFSIIFTVAIGFTASCGVSENTNSHLSRSDSGLKTNTSATKNAVSISLAATQIGNIAVLATKAALVRAGDHEWATDPPGPTATKDISTSTPLPARDGPTPKPYRPFHTPLPGRGVLIDHAQAPFPSAEFLAVNKWVFETNERAFEIVAGWQGSQGAPDQLPHQGMIIVMIWDISNRETDPLSERIISTKRYLTPTRDGSVRILDVQIQESDIHLSVITESGSRFIFYVNNGSFAVQP